MPTSPPQIDADSVVSAVQSHVSADLGDETVVMALDKGTYFGLDDVGTAIWALLKEARPVGEIRDLLVSRYEVDADTCERDLLSFLQRLAAEGLVEVRVAEAP